jgi:hypothetical protein
MNATSSTRLRLECLETRSLLSAIGFPLAPPVAPPSFAAAPSEFYRSGGNAVDHAAMRVAVQDAVALPGVNLMLAPDQLSPGLSESSSAAAVSNVNLMLAPDQFSPRLSDRSNAVALPLVNPIVTLTLLPPELGDPSYEAPAAGGRISDLAPMHDFHRTGDATNNISLLPSTAPAAPGGLADAGSAVPIQELPVTSDVVRLAAAEIESGGVTLIGTIDAGSVAPGLDMPRHGWLPSHGMAGDWGESMTFTTRPPQASRLPGEFAPDALPPFDPAASPHDLNDMQIIVEMSPVNRGQIVFRGPQNLPADQVVPASAESDAAPGIESPPSPVKGRTADVPVAYDPGRTGDQALAAVPTSLPTANGVANRPAINAAFADSAASNSMEGGLIALDDTSAPIASPGNAPLVSTGIQGAGGAELDRSNWLTDILPNPRRPVQTDNSSNKSARSAQNLAAEVFLRPAPAISQPVADVEEGGSIELAMVEPTPAASDGGSQLGGESSTGNAAQQLSDIRPESGVGLFCDIEVDIAPALPVGGSESAATAYPNAALLVADTGIHRLEAGAATETMPALTKVSQPTLAGLADDLPLLLGIAILVSHGGLRLEEKVPERERRLRCIENLRQPT